MKELFVPTSETDKDEAPSLPERQTFAAPEQQDGYDRDEALKSIDRWVKELCRNQYPNFSARTVFDRNKHSMSIWENAIEWGVGSATGRTDEEREARTYDEEYEIGMARAVESILEFIEERSDDDSDRVRHFCHSIRMELFSYSPSIINNIDIADAIHLSAKSSRNQFVREYISSSIIGENIYELAFMDTSQTGHIVERFATLPTEELVDVIRQMPTLIADAQAQGDWGEPAFMNIAVILEELRSSVTKPIVQYAINIATDRANEEFRHPSRGILVTEGDSRFGRMNEALDPENLELSGRLSGRIDLDKSIPFDIRAHRIATDAVAFLDNSLTPQYIARLNPETLDKITEAPLPPKIHELRHLLESISNADSPKTIHLENLIGFIREKLAENGADSAVSASWFSKISSVVEERQWSDYFHSEDFIETLHEDAGKESQRIHGELYVRLSEMENTLIRNTVENLRSALQKPAAFGMNEKVSSSVADIADPMIRDIESVMESNVPIQSLDSLLRDLIMFLRNNDLFPKLVSDFYQAVDTMAKERDALIEEYYSEEDRSRRRMLEEHEDELNACSEAIQLVKTTLQENWIEFRTDICAYAESELARLRKDDPSAAAHAVRYRNMTDIPGIVPFASNEQRPLLLQRLHEPEMLSHIGHDLGIDIRRFPIRSQIHFLTYIGDQDDSGFQRLRESLGKHASIADDLAYSFLATAEGPVYGDTILSLAERLNSEVLGPILKRYVEITKDADSVAGFVRESFPNLGSEALEREALAISKNLLRRGRDLLVEFSKHADTDPEALLRKLDDARADVILYKTAFQTLHESGSKEDLAEVMKSEIVSLRGAELSEEEQETLFSMYDRNYPESDRYPAEFREKIFNGLRGAFQNPDSRFYLLKHEGEIIGFRRFDAKGKTEDGKPKKYAGSFNIDPAYRDAKIGDVFYQVTLEQEGDGSVIEAMVDPEAPASSFYVERYGYVIDGVTDIGGKPFLMMKRDLGKSESFVTRGADFDEAISDIPSRAAEINERLSSVSVHTTERARLFDLVKEMTARGWTLTRLPYDKHGRDSGAVIAIFENPSLRKQATNIAKNESVPEAA